MGDRTGRWIIAAAVSAAMMLIVPTFAADLPLAPAPKSAPAPIPAPAPKPAPVQAPASSSPLAPPTATCREWSDGCRTCQRAVDGNVACSNIGIACVPKVATCTADVPAR
jgi:hypothetical protein